jgi:hypothetical protein
VAANPLSTSAIQVTWSAVSGATYYNVYDGPNTVSTTGTSYTWSGLSPNTRICSIVQAVNNAGGSSWSGWVCVNSWASAPGGLWNSPANGASLSGNVNFSAQAYPTNSTDPAISYVAFTANIGGTWKTLCTPSSHSGSTYTCSVNLASFGAGNSSYTISFDVYDTAGRVNYAPNGTRNITYSVGSPSYGTYVVDDQSGGFAYNGTSSNWYGSSGGYNNYFRWTPTRSSGVDNRAMWTPNLPAAGYWQVLVYVPSTNATTTNARYRIDHNGSQTTVCVNQGYYYNAWVGLGTYYFPSGGGVNGEVFLGDETYESSTHQIAFDAVEWVWVGS